jgi:ABC-2 type transport system ATP-binding protein
MAVAIEASGLGRCFGTLVALDNFNFTVPEGELFALVGPDGAGKTTLMRILAGLLRPSRGQARVMGHDVALGGQALSASIGYMSQRFGLYTDLTVHENLAFFADLQGVPPREVAARMARLLDFSGLSQFQTRLAGQLSGGMKQKLGLACALIHEPRVLLLDEPTNGVDPVSRRDFWRILYQLVRERGVTIVVSTAYLDEAERCGRLALLDHGHVLALDEPAAIKRLVGGTLYAFTSAHARAVASRLRPLFAPGAVALFGDRVHVFVKGLDELAIASAALAESGLEAGPAVQREPSLEDVFVAVLAAREASHGR